jgi:hypothetical protein
MIVSKQTARDLAHAGERFIEALNTALLSEQRGEVAELEQLKRAVGLVIGKIEVELLAPIYRAHPELEPENHK